MKKLVGLRTKFEPPNDESDELSESMALLSKNIERDIIRLKTWAKGNTQTRKLASSSFNPTKFGRMQGGTSRPNPRSKSTQCRDCGGYGHIQIECSNERKN